MRFMMLVKADKASESGRLPTREALETMGKYNEELVKAGVMLAGEGLHPSSRGARVTISPSGKKTVKDGPFSEAKELVAGFWMIQVKSKEEAVEWAKRIPPQPEGDFTVELRQIFEAEDFGPVLTSELRDQEKRLRAKAGKRR